jgi:hypothetical protein
MLRMMRLLRRVGIGSSGKAAKSRRRLHPAPPPPPLKNSAFQPSRHYQKKTFHGTQKKIMEKAGGDIVY